MVGVLGITASANAASEHHFFARTVSSSFSDTGFSNVELLYVGNHSSHSAKPIGTAHLSCVVTSQDRALCNGFIELPGGTLQANHVSIPLGENPIVEINGGTGEFAGANGYVRTLNITDSTLDFTVVLH